MSQPGREGERKRGPGRLLIPSRVTCLWEVEMVRRPCRTEDARSERRPVCLDENLLQQANRCRVQESDGRLLRSPTGLKPAHQPTHAASRWSCSLSAPGGLRMEGTLQWERTLRGGPT